MWFLLWLFVGLSVSVFLTILHRTCSLIPVSQSLHPYSKLTPNQRSLQQLRQNLQNNQLKFSKMSQSNRTLNVTRYFQENQNKISVFHANFIYLFSLKLPILILDKVLRFTALTISCSSWNDPTPDQVRYYFSSDRALLRCWKMCFSHAGLTWGGAI